MSLLRRYLPTGAGEPHTRGRPFADELIVAGIVIVGLEPRELLRRRKALHQSDPMGLMQEASNE